MMTFRLPSRIAGNIVNFTGRTWLLPTLLDWLEKTDDRMFILTGKPGSGKSTVAAWLAGHGPTPAEPEARARLERFRTRVKAAHFCVAASRSTSPKACAENLANQLTNRVKGFSDVLAKSLAERVQIVGEVRAGEVKAGAEVSLTGVHIGQLDLGALGDEASFDRALLEPVEKLYEGGYDEPMVLVVDSLDEAATYRGDTDLVRLLAKLEDLPKPIRFLATTRRDQRVLKYYPSAKRFDLILDAPASENDVQLYVYERLSALEDDRRDTLAKRIAEAAEGNFLYAHLVLTDLLHHLVEVADTAMHLLPTGLGGVYRGTLNREVGPDEKAWEERFKPVLGPIAVAQGEGLTALQLEAITGKEVGQALRTCSQYLDGQLPNGPFRIFHRSFTEFLLEDEENIDYHIDASPMHQLIADYYWQYHDDWSNCGDYGLEQLPHHLSEATRLARTRPAARMSFGKLSTLLTELPYLEAKLAGFGTDALMADFNAAVLVGPSSDVLAWRRVLDREAHHLRYAMQRDHAPFFVQPAFLAQQLHNRAVQLEVSAVAAAAKDRIREIGTSTLLLRWRTSRASEALERVLYAHVQCLELLDDDRRLVTGDEDGMVEVWDLDTGATLHRLDGHTAAVVALATSHDQQRVVSASRDATLRIWDLATGIVRHTLTGHEGEVTAVAVSANDRHAVSASADGTLRVWNLENGYALKVLERPDTLSSLLGQGPVAVLDVALTADGDRALAAYADGTVALWDLPSGRMLASVDTNRGSFGTQPAHTLAIAGDYAFALSGEPALHMWWLGGECPLSESAFTVDTTAFAVRADGLRVVTGGRTGFAQEWDTEMAVGRKPAPPVDLDPSSLGYLGFFRGRVRLFQAHEWKALTCVAMSRDGGRAVTGSADKTLRVWNLEDGGELQVLEGHAGPIRDVRMSSNGRRAVSTASDGTVRIWTLGAREGGHRMGGHATGVDAVAICGGRGISVSRDGELRAWEVASGVMTLSTRTSTRATEHVGPHIVGAALASDGKRAAWAGERLMTFDLDRRKEHRADIDLRRLGEHSAVSADARSAVTSSRDGTLRLWDLEAMSVIREIPSAEDGEVTALAFTPDGRLAIVVSQPSWQSSLVRLIDVGSGAEVIRLTTDQSWIDSVAASADAGRIVAGTLDGALVLWDLRPPRALAHFRGTGQVVSTSFGKRAAITEDGRIATTGSAVGAVRVWNEDDPEHCHNVLWGGPYPTTAITLTAHGTRLAVAAADHTVSVWNAGTGEKLAVARLDGPPVTMDAEGHLLLVGDLDGDVLCFEYVEPDLADIWLSLSRLNHGLPRGQTHPEVVQGTAEFHHQIPNALLPQPKPVFDDATALHTAVDVLDPQPTLMQRLVRVCLEFMQKITGS